MERLTVPDEKIEGGWRRAVIDTREVRKEAMTIYWALKKYEDTGLTPTEVQELKERDTPKKPDIDGDGYDKEGNIILDTWICPNCGACYEIDYDDYDFCPNCGQQIDRNEIKKLEG